jgi:ERCC4-related helicase
MACGSVGKNGLRIGETKVLAFYIATVSTEIQCAFR